ncbi:hypothetical protein ACFIOY_35595 [Bradyrhizobium sp. TZ2]
MHEVAALFCGGGSSLLRAPSAHGALTRQRHLDQAFARQALWYPTPYGFGSAAAQQWPMGSIPKESRALFREEERAETARSQI